MLKAGASNTNTLLEALEKSASQAERAGKIISRIRDFVKRSEPRRQRVKVRTILDNAVAFAEIDARKRQIEIRQQLPDPMPDVLADPILIEQVLLNLLKNGVEAMEKSSYHVLHVNVSQLGSMLEIAVIDRGHGLRDPERLFEPFYSTKSEGLGMGLNICRTIIESHHGRLWADQNPEGGTIFRFTLPCAPEGSPETQEDIQEHNA